MDGVTTTELLQATLALGWHGQLLTDMQLLGDHVHIVVDATDQRIDVVGVLAARCGWRAAMRAASGFVAFAPRAVLLPEDAPYGAYVQAVAAHTGVGVVRIGETGVQVVAWPSPPAMRRRTLAHRLIKEAVHARLVAHAAVGVH